MAAALLAAASSPGGVPGQEPVAGQEPSVRAYVTPGTTVGVGASFVLNVEVSGTQQVERDPTLPELSSFARYLGSSSQSSVQVVNGRTTVSVTLEHRYQAVAEGTHTIPSFEVEVQGETFTTEPIRLTVSADAAARPTEGAVGPDDLFITAEPSKRVVYEGEPLILEYRIWTRVDVSRFGMTTVPEPEGFWVEDVTPPGQPPVEERTRNGVGYVTAVIRRVALVPTGAGRRTVEPIGVEAQVRVRSGRDPFEDFFGRSSLFGTRTVPTTVLADPVTVDVRPLPAGVPAPYSGMVGSLELSATLDRDSVAINDAVTLTIRASGEGNVRAFPEPELDLPTDFEVFPPEVSDEVRVEGGGLAGTRTFEYVLIPRAPGSREIPPVRYAWLDDGAGEYRVASTEPLPLTVSGSGAAGEMEALGRSGVAELRRDIRFIRLGPLDLRREDRFLVDSPAFWLFALLPLAVLGGAVALRRHRDRLEGDVAYARGRRASRVARKRLRRARGLMESGDAGTFCGEVARALRGLVADRLNLAEAGLRTDQIDDLLRQRVVAEELRREVSELLEECDRQRFAPSETDGEERRRLLERAGRVMTELDRAIR